MHISQEAIEGAEQHRLAQGGGQEHEDLQSEIQAKRQRMRELRRELQQEATAIARSEARLRYCHYCARV